MLNFYSVFLCLTLAANYPRQFSLPTGLKSTELIGINCGRGCIASYVIIEITVMSAPVAI